MDPEGTPAPKSPRCETRPPSPAAPGPASADIATTRRTPLRPPHLASRVAARLFATMLAVAASFGVGVPFGVRALHADDAATAGADVLVLKDGRTLAGTVVAESDDGVTFRAGGTTRLYARADVERVARGGASAKPAGGDARGATPAPPGEGADPAATEPAPGKPAIDKSTGKAVEKGIGKKGKVLTEASRAWIRDLAARAATDDDQVRRSIAAALRALGPAAVPAIRDCAAAATDPAARQLLERVAADMEGRGGRADEPDRPAMDDAGMAPEAPGARPGADTPPAPPRRPGRDALERLLADLELRDDQRPKMAELLGGLERRQFEMLREIRQGTLAPDRVPLRIEEVRKATLDASRAILDDAQYDVFDDRAQRYFDAMLVRATRGEAKTPAPAPPPAPTSPPDEPAK